MNDFFLITYYYAHFFIPLAIFGNFKLFCCKPLLTIICYFTIGYSRLFYCKPLLTILHYFTMG
jgi:hypothetical protein